MAKLDTLTDAFSSTLSGSWAVNGAVATSNGALSVAVSGDAHTAATYDATSSYGYVQVSRLASGGATAPVTNMVFQSVTGGTNVRITKDSGTNILSFQSQVGFSDGTPTNIYYHPIDHAWWRIREASGTTYFETSPDGSTWTVQRSISSPAWMNVVTVYLSVDNTPTTGAYFDNFNTAPAPVSWYVRKTGSDNNGGSSASTSPDQSGTDGVTNNTTTFTSVGATFTSGDVGKGINVAGAIYRVVGRTSNSIITVDRNIPATASGVTWKLGGALATLGKVLATATLATTSSSFVYQSSDNVYVGAGTYREVLAAVGTNFVSQVTFVGDVDGAKTGDAGEVVVTAYTTNDKTAPSSTSVVSLNNGSSPYTSFWSYRNITFVGGVGNPRFGNISESFGNWFINCTFFSSHGTNNGQFSILPAVASFKGICFEGCRYFGAGTAFSITLPTATPGEWEVGLFYRNCTVVSLGTMLDVTASGALAHKGGGVYAYNCTIISSGNPVIRTNSANISTTFPVRVENCMIFGGAGTTVLSGNAASQLVEKNNLIVGSTPRNANVSAGAGSISDGSYAAIMSIGQELQWGGIPVPLGMPVPGSSIVAFGSSGNGPATDITGAPRPATSLQAVGAYERANTSWVKETSTVHTGSNALSITGPGYVDFLLPVDSTSTTVTVYVRWDGTYAGTKPQMQVINGTDVGVANATATAVGSSGSWEQLSLTFTPTAKGIVTMRVLSNDTNGAGHAYLDSWAVA